MADFTVGDYLAERFAQLGIWHHFVVPGDYNLILLDKLMLHPQLSQICCTNELNCAFAAEGYARANGLSACVVTYSVGAFSAFNGVGGAYAENLPLILVSGSPNTNDVAQHHIVHHTLGIADFTYQIQMAEKITCCAVAVKRAQDAPTIIDRAIRAAVLFRKPVYIEIPTNLAGAACVRPGPISAVSDPKPCDACSLTAAIQMAGEFVNQHQKPVILVGSKFRDVATQEALLQLAKAIGCAVVVQPGAKGCFPEAHKQFAGIFWGQISTLAADSIINWADVIVCAGTVFNDYTTVGWTTDLTTPRLAIDMDCIKIPGATFTKVKPAEFLTGLAQTIHQNATTLLEYQRFKPDPPLTHRSLAQTPLTRKEISRQVQALLTATTTVFVDTGDSWFNGVQMQLPEGAKFEIEMQWGHIGWSIPAAFGYSVAEPDRQVVVMVGDGAFQVTVQELSQMIRHNKPIIILLMNNQGYTIEVEIHDGPYNRIQDWNYAELIHQFNSRDGQGKGLCVRTDHELAKAIDEAKARREGPTLIECVINQDDCSKELVTWGHYVSVANSRPPLHA
ncbi:thiamine diphosphate-binding protein [Aspergillus granulosus]|uniref:Pyruvate decarboxylase n=1 Tax=Aspergillus granulosus TaxID=176169 RepID=A0ABR4I0J8_9EURO